VTRRIEADLDVPIPERAELVIVGAGVMGLAIAYNLCKLGLTDIVILDKGYLAAGASGRNGGGIRQQWSTELHIRLMQESVKLCKRFAKELGVNIWFRQGGYLFLAHTREQLSRLERNLDLQRRCGVDTRMVDADEAQQIVPQLDTSTVLGAAYNPSDGILFPWPFLWGYAQGAAKLGAQLFTHTEVTAIDVESDGFRVHTPRGAVRAKRVLNACGAWSPAIAKMVGVDLPTYPISARLNRSNRSSVRWCHRCPPGCTAASRCAERSSAACPSPATAPPSRWDRGSSSPRPTPAS